MFQTHRCWFCGDLADHGPETTSFGEIFCCDKHYVKEPDENS